jgi:hypothetical protein
MPAKMRPAHEVVNEYWAASAQVQQGELAAAAALVARLAGKAGDNAGTYHYTAALVYARLSGAAADHAEAEEYGARAVELLRQARTGHYFATPYTRYLLQTERDLGPLRGRADFQKLLADVERETRAPATRD